MNDLMLFSNLKDQELKKKGIVIAEGRFIAERMLASGLEILGVICIPALAAHFQRLAGGKCPVQVMETAALAALTGYPFHRGVLAAAKRPQPAPLSSYLEKHPAAGRLVVLPATVEIENMGSIIRSAAAFNLDAVFIGAGCCDPFSRKAVRCAMGAAFTLPLLTGPEAINTLQAAHFRIICAAQAANAVNLEDFPFPQKTALVFGNEATGLEPAWLEAAASLVAIPVSTAVDSLNVGVAAGIFFHALSNGKR